MLAGLSMRRPQSRRLGLLLAVLTIVFACSTRIPNENDRFVEAGLDDRGDRPLVGGEEEFGIVSTTTKGQAPEVDADDRLLRRPKEREEKRTGEAGEAQETASQRCN